MHCGDQIEQLHTYPHLPFAPTLYMQHRLKLLLVFHPYMQQLSRIKPLYEDDLNLRL